MHSACQNHTVHINTLVYFIFNRLCPTIIRNKVLNQNLRVKEVFKNMSIGISIKAVSSKKRKEEKNNNSFSFTNLFSYLHSGQPANLSRSAVHAGTRVDPEYIHNVP